jgi:cell division initiation protein
VSEEQESALELELQDTDMSVTPHVTPNEIRNAEFGSAMRGFNREEVDEFLQKTASSLEDSLTETLELREQYESLQKKYDKLAGMEDALKSTLLEAQKTADSIRAKAGSDAELTLERARGKQVLIEEQARERIAQLQEKVSELDKIRLDYQAKIQATISSHLKIVEEISFGVELPELPEESDLSDLESAEIEEVSLFEPTLSDSERVAQSNDIANAAEVESADHSEKESQAQNKPQVSESLHSDLTVLTDSDSAPDEKQSLSNEAPSTNEAIANAVEGRSSTENNSDMTGDDTLYKKLASDSEETAQKTETDALATDEQQAKKPKAPIRSGSDGIVVFGRKEDREKAVEENARILSELDSVVDKFAEELREIDSK